MAEDEHVSKDQHRADMAELRGDLKDEVAGLRHNVAELRGDLKGEIGAVRQELKEELAGVRQDVAVLTKTVEHQSEIMNTGFSELRQDMRELRQQMQVFQTNTQRQMWVIVMVVAAAIITAVVKLLFFPTPIP